mmetsp:Transcript_14023/g.22735  ORF Transcript_14023/g.22735 Transcript_14023/m.22735 type:complete len:141 (-) Transcript_14023:104-526(-)
MGIQAKARIFFNRFELVFVTIILFIVALLCTLTELSLAHRNLKSNNLRLRQLALLLNLHQAWHILARFSTSSLCFCKGRPLQFVFVKLARGEEVSHDALVPQLEPINVSCCWVCSTRCYFQRPFSSQVLGLARSAVVELT